MTQNGHKTDAVFRRYNITTTQDLEHATDLLAGYRDSQAKAATERTADVVVH
jgi:hypothetical protein